jgi:Flp pilus assembly protein TadG
VTEPWCATRADERGSASAQLVIATPALLLLLMVVVQFALYQHASHLVTAAAQEGVEAAQVERGSAGAGSHAAEAFLAQTNRGVVRSTSVDVSRSARETHVVVSARVVSLVPGLDLAVRGVADGPNEVFVSQEER